MNCCQLVGVVLLLLCQILSCIMSHDDSEDIKCPIDFQVAYNKRDESAICYSLKGPEAYEDFYEDCVGNMFSVSLYRDLDINTSDNITIWTEYRSFYTGGLFIDTSLTNRFGNELETNLSSNNIDESWCIVLIIQKPRNYTYKYVKCSDKHYRYCFVEPYPDEMTHEGCEDFKGSVRYRSPTSTCVAALKGTRGTPVRATWSQARRLCTEHGGKLLYAGRRYANNLILTNKFVPLDVEITWVDSSSYYKPLGSEWFWNNTMLRGYDGGPVVGAQSASGLYMMQASHLFYDVVCERAVPLQNVAISVTIDYDKGVLKRKILNGSIDPNYIKCYTDSVKANPTGLHDYQLNKNGYYWCSHSDVLNFKPTESNKILYIKKPESTKNIFAIKIYLNETYSTSNFKEIFERIWKTTLSEYLSYKYQYESIYGTLNETTAETELSEFMAKNRDLASDGKRPKYDVKRFYLDYRTVLIHMRLDPPRAGRVSPGAWRGVRVVSCKPVYYCTGLDLPDTPLGGSVNVTECRTFDCVGEFNEGVDWFLKRTEGCVAPDTSTARTSSRPDDNRTWSDESSEESTELTPNATAPLTTDDRPGPAPTVAPTTMPTVLPPRPPKPTTMPTPTVDPPTELPTTTAVPPPQVGEVIGNLEDLVTQTNVTVEDIQDVFTQVDAILKEHELGMPEQTSQMLHLLDQLGSIVVLNETGKGQTVGPNIALLMADAHPDNPVRGFRVSIVNDTFHDQDFTFITEYPNSTVLSTSNSEIVVNLPSSLSETQRRVSFLVFRNDRAFQSEGYAVNSRVISVNVENVTHFHGEEVIDIHLSPLHSDLARNESRACAYWHFPENISDNGYWSQEGCTFIRSTEDGTLDMCRCNHLTHFAEVLAPRAVFSEAAESALEIISIVGCILSILGLIMIGVTALLFRSWRREFSNKIWLQLCMAIFVLVLSFLLVIFVHFDQYDTACLLVGVLLHYAVLASFCWMLVAAVLAYRRLVLVFSRDASHKLMKAAAFSWGAPCVVVGVLLSISRDSYARKFEEMTPSGAFCYPTGLGFWLAVYAPISAILLTNWILFALIVRSVFVSRRIQRHGENNEALRCASVSCMLVFLFGLPWVFGLFASNVVAAYLFTLTATFQGFILFIFFVIGNQKTRDLWLNKLHIKQTRKLPVTSSTYTNRSVEWRAANPSVTPEAKVSKPKALASKDETRYS